MVQQQQKRGMVIGPQTKNFINLIDQENLLNKNQAKQLVLNPDQGSGLPKHSPVVHVAGTRCPEGLELTAGV